MKTSARRPARLRRVVLAILVPSALVCGCSAEVTGSQPSSGDERDQAGLDTEHFRPRRDRDRRGPDTESRTDTDAHVKLTECPSCEKDFALHDPRYVDDGVWEDAVTALVTVFEKFRWTYERVGPEQINTGSLGAGDTRRFRGVVAPGGWAWWRNVAVTTAGEDNLRSFVESGGNFVGFCAGAYWAADTVTFAEGDRDYKSYDYDLALWPGAVQGPLAWMPWSHGTNANLLPVAVDTSNPTMAAISSSPSVIIRRARGRSLGVSGDSSLTLAGLLLAIGAPQRPHRQRDRAGPPAWGNVRVGGGT